MAYYQGDYYQGDYYQGDPFLGLGAIFGAAKWIGKKIFKRKPKPQIMPMRYPGRPPIQLAAAGAAAPFLGRVASSALGSVLGRGFARDRDIVRIGQQSQAQRVPGVRGTIQRILPGGETGYLPPPRRMNVANPKALRRSLRRVAGFGKLACRARRDIQRAATAVGAGGGRRRACPPRGRKCA